MVRNLVISGSSLCQPIKKVRPVRKEKRQLVSGSVKISLMALAFVLAAAVIFSGALYLYQVNSLATQGYEIKNIEDQIRDIEKENKKLKIKEVELKSMYNIEKSTQDLNLVSPADISYVEIESPVSMK